jgi:hypothetical protein
MTTNVPADEQQPSHGLADGAGDDQDRADMLRRQRPGAWQEHLAWREGREQLRRWETGAIGWLFRR